MVRDKVVVLQSLVRDSVVLLQLGNIRQAVHRQLIAVGKHAAESEAVDMVSQIHSGGVEGVGIRLSADYQAARHLRIDKQQ